MSATYDDLCCQVGQIIAFSVRQKEFFTQFGLTVIPLNVDKLGIVGCIEN